MAYDPSAYQESIRKYLKEMGQDNYDPNASGGGGGGGGGGAGGAIGGLAASLALKYGLTKGKEILAKYLVDQGITKEAALEWAGKQLGLKGAGEAGTQAAAQAGTQAATETATLGAGTGAGAVAGMEALGGGLFSIPAGVAAPAGYTAVATGINGGTLVAANSSILGGAAGTGAGAGAASGAAATTTAGTGAAAGGGASTAAVAGGIAAIVLASYLRFKALKGMQKQYGTGLTDEEIIKSTPIVGKPLYNLEKSTLPEFMRMENNFFHPLGLGMAIDQAVWGGHKNEQQLMRDRTRHYLQESGVLDDKFNISLADGSKFDLGRDGSNFTLQNTDGTERNYWDPDHTVTKYNPYEAQALIQPLAVIAGGGKLGMLGHLENAAGSNAQNDTDIFNNARAFAKSLGLTQDNYAATIDKLKEDGNFDDATANIYKGKLSWLTGGDQAEASGQGAYQQKLRDFLSSIKINTANDVYAKNLAAQAAAQGANG